MTLNQTKGFQIQDQTLTRRDSATLPVISVTRRTPNGEITQIIREGVVHGKTIREVEDISYTAQGLTQSVTFTSTVNGGDRLSYIEQVNRDQQGRMISTTILPN